MTSTHRFDIPRITQLEHLDLQVFKIQLLPNQPPVQSAALTDWSEWKRLVEPRVAVIKKKPQELFILQAGSPSSDYSV